MSGHVGDLSPNQEEILQQFKERLADVMQPSYDDYFLLKWLRAREWKINKSEEMFRKSLVFKKQMKVEDYENWEILEVLQKYYPGGMCGFDKEGSPIWVDPIGCIDPSGLLLSARKAEIIKFILCLSLKLHKVMEEQTVKLGHKVENITIIIDFVNIGIQHANKAYLNMYGEALGMFEANFPESLKQCFIVRAPRLFSVGYNIVKPFLHEETRKRVRILGRNWRAVLLNHIDPDQLPKMLGGTQTDPDGDPKCPSKIKRGGIVPDSYYITNRQLSDENAKTLTVNSGMKTQLKLNVKKSNTVIKWEFKTEGGDIGFGLFQHTAGEESQSMVDMVHLVPYQRVQSHVYLESGLHTCEAAGTYILMFDNEYSWFTQKKLHYSVEMLHPDSDINEQMGQLDIGEGTAAAAMGETACLDEETACLDTNEEGTAAAAGDTAPTTESTSNDLSPT